MDRGIPVSNKICFDKDLKRIWKIHEDKLRSLKGSVGKQRPPQYCFLDQRLKKGALQQVRNIQIERQNRILLQKIKHISEKKSNKSYFIANHEKQNKKKTLREPYRKRELVKIVQENQQIMKRIQQKKSCYNIKKLQKQRKEIEKNISLISEYPFKNYPLKNTKTNLWMTQENFANRTKLSDSMIRNISLTYTGTRKINNNYYIVTSYLKNKTFYVELENLQLSSEKYRMELDQNQARNLLSGSYNNNLQELISNLQIDGDSCYLKYQIKSLHQ